jgi:hypothetical protein
MRAAGWALSELKDAGFDAGSLIGAGYSVAELKLAGTTALELKGTGCSALQLLPGSAFSTRELLNAGYAMAELYSIPLGDASDPEALACAHVYYADVEFAFQLCSEFAAAEISNSDLSASLRNARDALQLIVEHNTHLKAALSERQPAWPRHEALLLFDLPLHRLTSHSVESSTWFPHNFSLRGSRLYYSDGKNGHPDSAEGTLAFMRSNPAPDGRYCFDLEGMHALLAN